MLVHDRVMVIEGGGGYGVKERLSVALTAVFFLTAKIPAAKQPGLVRMYSKSLRMASFKLSSTRSCSRVGCCG